MGNDDEIQMCSVEESCREDTLYDFVQDNTLEAEDAFQEELLFLRPCYPA